MGNGHIVFEKNPLEQLAPNGGFCGIFHTIGCIGDSMSSGEFECINEQGVRSGTDRRR